MRRRALLLSAAALGASGARAQPTATPQAPAELHAEWPGAVPARAQGSASLRFLGLLIYDITLWAPEPVAEPAGLPAQPLALAITYRRALDGGRIAERSLAEMRRGGPVDEATADRWLQAMRRLFPDVRPDDRITGVLRPGAGARFHLNARPLGDWPDAPAAARFFGIWLAPWTSEPGLRRALLGGS